MRKAFVIVSVSDRVIQLNGLVRSIRAQRRFDDYDLCLLYQDYQHNRRRIERPEQFATLLVHPVRLGCNAARVMLLRAIAYDVYVNLDDDMFLVAQTNYDRAITKALQRDTGFVLTNWARTASQLEAKSPKMADRFLPQVMVYQGGGMVYGEKIAELIRPLPLTPTMFDDIWPLTAYVNGYRNYRYLGSLAIHEICATGGMRAFMRETNPALACPDLINYRRGKRPGEYLIPLDGDIAPKAHLMHEQAKRRRRDEIARYEPQPGGRGALGAGR